MLAHVHIIKLLSLTLVTVSAVSCTSGDAGTGSDEADALGSLKVVTSTQGKSVDQDGYVVTIDNRPSKRVGVNDTATFTALSPGNGSVMLSDIALNCALEGDPIRTAQVHGGSTTTVPYDVHCTAMLSNQIVFGSFTTGNAEIFVVNPDGTGLQQLTNDPGQDAKPMPSPDGTMIAFVRRDPVTDKSAIWVMDADGENQQQITDPPSGAYRPIDTDPSWSPEAVRLVFSSNRTSTANNPRSALYIMNADGTGLTQLPCGDAYCWDPSWSPVADQIAFVSRTSSSAYWSVFLIKTDGTSTAVLTSSGDQDVRPTWSPDGSRIAFATDRDGSHEIYVMNVDGSNPIRLTTDPSYDCCPTWSPDGLRIAFVRESDGNADIYVMNADGSGVVRVDVSSQAESWPAWSR